MAFHALLTDDERAFAANLRDFYTTEIPIEIRRRHARAEITDKEGIVTTHRILNAHGYAVPGWPVEWGGQDWTPMQRHLWLDEMQLASVPRPLSFNATMIGPVLAQFGTEEQKQRFLPPTANLDIWWCQGFSEPNAGSDLASLRTTAVRDGDSYVVNGQKMWTTQAHFADWMFCLVRTNPDVKKQAGISMLLIDMTTPGITTRPIHTIDGQHEVNEVFFDNVAVPAENLVGEENRGWTYAKFLLGNERVGQARVGASKVNLARVKALAGKTRVGAGTLLDDPLFAARLATLEIELTALEMTQLRVLTAQTAGNDAPDPRSSVLKLKGTKLQQDIAELQVDVLGMDGVPIRDGYDVPDGFATPPAGAVEAMPTYLFYRKATIYGGASEVQRNIIAKAILNF